jgi:hypothetical protein
VGDESEQPHLVIKAQQERMRVEYEGRLAELERERESIVSEKAQVGSLFHIQRAVRTQRRGSRTADPVMEGKGP